MTKSSCNEGTVKYLEVRTGKKHEDTKEDIRRFYSNFIEVGGFPYVTFKGFKNLYTLS